MVKNIIPSTKTPVYVFWILLAIVVSFGIFLILLLGLLFNSIEILWGIFILLVFLASSTPFYTESNVPAFNALILVNSWTGGMRVIFPGVNLKLPWEIAQYEGNEKKYINLRTQLIEVCNETYASKDALMETKYVYTISLDFSEYSGESAGEKILIFSSFKSSAIKSETRAFFSMLFSDYYGDKEGKNLLDKNKINLAIFGTEENPKEYITKFEEKHGIKITVLLEKSNFDKATQKFRDIISAAQSFDEAVKKLVTGGMERSQAEKIVKLMNLDGYTEKDFNLNVNAPHLTNLRDVSILGGGLIDDNKKKGVKK